MDEGKHGESWGNQTASPFDSLAGISSVATRHKRCPALPPSGIGADKPPLAAKRPETVTLVFQS